LRQQECNVVYEELNGFCCSAAGWADLPLLCRCSAAALQLWQPAIKDLTLNICLFVVYRIGLVHRSSEYSLQKLHQQRRHSNCYYPLLPIAVYYYLLLHCYYLLLHCYYIIITLLLHHYYIIITLLLHHYYSLLHHYYFVITHYYFVITHYYIVITLLLLIIFLL
jgi:hypothetical protein